MTIPNNQVELDKVVNNFKSFRLIGFNDIISEKVEKVAAYLKNANIQNVVLGVSGGIDSAVVLALLVKVQELIPLTIHAYTIHFDLYDMIFKTEYVDVLEEKFKDIVVFKTVDASKSFNLLMEDLGEGPIDNQIRAQSSYALRYQMLFTYAQKHKAVTIGTTNRDEFEYAGWFGKNSDMVVDLQIITDWHKFQVIEAAKFLNIPDCIIERAPAGDLLDSSTDEQNFGCTYNELAYFASICNLRWLIDDNQFMIEKFAKLRALHGRNAHKYQGQTFNPFFIR